MTDAPKSLPQNTTLGHDITPPDPVAMAFRQLSDLGNAERLIELAGGRLVHVAGMGWLAYDGRRWSAEQGARLAAIAAHDVAKHIKDEARALADIASGEVEGPDWVSREMAAERLKKLHEWSVTSGNANKTAAMLVQASNLLTAERDDFDRDPFALNCLNGTLRIVRQSGAPGWRIAFAPHDPADRLTRLANVEYDPDARCPGWEENLAQVLPDAPVRDFFQKCVGYSATGDVSEQVIFMLQGRGGDGKSTVMNVLRAVFGDYTRGASAKTFMEGPDRSGSEASPDIARLAGDTRLVLTSEPKRGKAISEDRIKTITGGGTIDARDMYEKIFEFAARFKLFLECNSRPRISGDDDGIWRRIMIINFPMQFLGDDADKKAPARLTLEASGILNWVLAGTLAWLEAGKLDPPPAVIDAVEDYRRSANPFGEWMAERVDTSDPRVLTLSADLLADYKKWCEDNGVADREIMTSTAFGRALGDRQILRGPKDRSGKIRRRGAQLRTPDDLLPPRGLGEEELP